MISLLENLDKHLANIHSFAVISSSESIVFWTHAAYFRMFTSHLVMQYHVGYIKMLCSSFYWHFVLFNNFCRIWAFSYLSIFDIRTKILQKYYPNIASILSLLLRISTLPYAWQPCQVMDTNIYFLKQYPRKIIKKVIVVKIK